jgi:N-acetylneuraminate synthase
MESRTAAGFSIDGREIGPGRPCFVIAEIAQAHDGSLGAAHAYIDAVAKAGADAIKFQTHIAEAETTPREPWRVQFSKQDTTRYDYWKRMEFSPEQWAGLAAHAREKKLVFLSTPFSEEALELLEKIGMPAWKIGGAEVTNERLIARAARTGRPVILSSGMATWAELDRAVASVRAGGAPPAVLQCTTIYPCPPEKLGLALIPELRARFGCPVGLSDHSASVFAGPAAAALGANLLEVHAVFSKECFGPDTSSSLTTPELAQMIAGVRFVEAAVQSAVDKDAMAEQLAPLRKMFGKSIVLRRDLPAGAVLGGEDLALKKPGDGLPPSRLNEMIGRRLARAVTAGSALMESDLV